MYSSYLKRTFEKVEGLYVVRPPENGHMNFYDASVRDQYSSSTSEGVL